MSQQEHSEENLLPIPEPIIQQQVENSALGGGMQAAIGNDNIQIQGDSNVITFNKTEILQISVTEIKTRKFIETSPYKGLKKFEKEDKDLFFGRDQFLTSLVNELEQTNLVLLLGASGSGKSSVVRAGLVPWLFQKYGTRLVNLIFTPDQDPFESLYASLLSKNTQNQAQIAREAKADTLTQVVTRLKQADDYWFILIDQFEELFTTSQPEKRDRFIASLVQLARAKVLRVKIMATMRADFFDKLSPYPALVKATDKHRPMIAEMQLDELRLAIEQPTAHHGVVFEIGLVEEIIKDVQGQAGYLPLLQYTLNLLWETEVKTSSINDRTLNISTYRELGGVRGALQQRVDKIYEDLSAQEKIVTQRIFLKLVDIGGDGDSDTEWKPVRRRAPRSEFSNDFELGVLTTLINNNLLVSDSPAEMLCEHPLKSQQSTVEIAHETLLTSWATLNTWIKENRNSIALRNRLNDDVERWEASKAEDELWTGSKLEKLLELKNDATFNQVLGGFSQTANQFIDDSLGLRDQQLRRARRTTMVSVILAMLASAGGVISLFLWQDSQKQSVISLTRSAESLLLANNQLDAMVEALRAWRNSKNLLVGKDEVSDKIFGGLQQVAFHNTENEFHERLRLHGWNVTLSPDGELIAASDENNHVWLSDVKGNKIANLSGHSDIILKIVFSPNSKLLATASYDGTVRLWNSSGKLVSVLQGHSDGIKGVAFSPNGSRLATASEDNTARIWDISGKLLFVLRGHSTGLANIAFSDDGKLLATASYDNTARLWDSNGKLVAELRGHSNSVTSVVFSPNSKQLATVSDDQTARVWDNKGKFLFELRGHSGGVNSVVFSPDGKQLAAALEDKTTRVWNNSGKFLFELRGHSGGVNSVVFSPDNKQLVTPSEDKTVRFWDTSGKLLAELDGYFGSVYSVMFSQDGKRLVTASEEGTVRLWENGRQKIAELPGRSSVSYRVVFTPGSEREATISPNKTASSDKTAQIWDTNGKLLAELAGHSDVVSTVLFSPDGRKLAVISMDKTARLWDISGKLLADFRGDSFTVSSVVFSPDSTRFATFSDDDTVRVWNTSGKQLTSLRRHSQCKVQHQGTMEYLTAGSKVWKTFGKQLASLRGHCQVINSVVFSPDGKHMATGSSDKTARVWDINGKQLAELRGHINSVNSVVFSPNGKRLATASSDKTARVWDINGKQLAELRGHINSVNSVVFSPDGKRLATASSDKTARVWDINGKLLAELRGHINSVNSVVFSPDGKRLATVSNDRTARLWAINGKQIAEWDKHYGRVSSVVFSPDAKYIATASDGRIAELFYDFENQLGGSHSSSAIIHRVAFSPDGERIATASWDNTVELWQVGGIEEMLVRSCNWVHPYLNIKPENDSDRHLCDGIGTTP
jgi:WD40 repeat protein